jgi:hypothetical protein
MNPKVKQLKLTNDLLKKNSQLLTKLADAEMEEMVKVLVDPFLKSHRDKVVAMKPRNFVSEVLYPEQQNLLLFQQENSSTKLQLLMIRR